MREGWICPSCRKGVRPDMTHCDHPGSPFDQRNVGPLVAGSPIPDALRGVSGQIGGVAIDQFPGRQ